MLRQKRAVSLPPSHIVMHYEKRVQFSKAKPLHDRKTVNAVAVTSPTGLLTAFLMPKIQHQGHGTRCYKQAVDLRGNHACMPLT